MRAAFADPPYFGQGRKHYKQFHSRAFECDQIGWHADLANRLESEFDGFVLCLSSTTLKDILPLFSDGVRVGAWVKPFASFKPGVNPGYAREPVIFKPLRKRDRSEDTVRDWVSANITMMKGCPGAKPVGFLRWCLDLLCVCDSDSIHDLFPGTGIMSLVSDGYFNKPVQCGLFSQCEGGEK